METLTDLATILQAHDDATRFLPREWAAPRTQAQIDADRAEEARVEAMFAQFE